MSDKTSSVIVRNGSYDLKVYAPDKIVGDITVNVKDSKGENSYKINDEITEIKIYSDGGNNADEITFTVDRLWSPKELFGSPDDRELGLFIGV